MIEYENNPNIDKPLGMMEQFLKVRSLSDKIEVNSENLPLKISLTLESEKEIQKHYLIAANLWEDSITKDKLEGVLETIDCDPSKYTKDIHKKLKHIRITGVILRDANCIFTKDHESSECFYFFIKKLGKLNDSFYSNKEYSIEEIILQMEKSKEEKDVTQPFFCSIDSMNSYIKNEINLINGLLDKKEFSYKEFHDLRKKSRIFLDYFLIKTLQNPLSSDFFKTYTFLRKINTELGNLIDNKEHQSIEQKIYYVPESTKESIETFLKRVVF